MKRKKTVIFILFFFLAGGARQSGAGFTRSGRMVAACRSIDTKKLACVS